MKRSGRFLRGLQQRQLLRRKQQSARANRSRRTRSVIFEVLEDRWLLAADLVPVVFGGWSDSVVISTQTGTNTDDSPITVADTVYFDTGWGNIGDAFVGTYRVEVRLDGNLIAANSSIPDGFFAFSDINAGSLSQGSHTVTLTLDTNSQIAENDETNNVRTRIFNVTAVGTEDFGDAPTAAQSGFTSSYPTLLADNGARHTPVAGFTIGSEIDTEADGQPNAAADLDDTGGTPDDEDGVTFIGTPAVGSAGSVEVFVTNTAGVTNPHLDVWIDFDRDGDWDEVLEHVFTGAAVAGTNTVNFSVPGAASAGQTFARFRLYDGTTPLAVTGLIADGEVEDHAVSIATPGVWIDQGPAPTQNAQLEPNTQPNQQVTGAIHTVLTHPTDSDTVYIGAVNGGIWKTTNATALNPTWVSQTDFLESLGIGAMAFDPTDGTHNTIVAGTAKYSSFAGFGGVRGPVYRTTDGGGSWVQLASNGLRTVGENISGIAARGSTIVVTSSGNFGGVFRSTDGGANFSPITSADFVSPNDDFSDLVVDPSDGSGQRLYAASVGVGGAGGIYRSDDFGLNWTKITGPAINSVMDDLLTQSNNIEMTVHPTTGRLYVAVLVSGQPRGIFHTNNATAASPTWTQMDVPVLPLNLAGGTALTGASNATPIVITSNGHGLAIGNYVVIDGVTGNTAANGFFRVSATTTNTFTLDGSAGNGAYVGGGTWTRVTGPNPTAKDIDETGAQGRIHFSIVVHPANEDILYIGGDRQEQPNVIGDNTFGGAIFRGDASITRNPNVVPSPQWDHATHDIVGFDPNGGTANGTATHADSREMAFDADGNLLETDDGGIYRRTNPLNNSGDWFSMAGNLGVVEFHDIAYDSNSDILIGGTQDNGTHFQMTPGGQVWDFLSGGDGGDVAVDNITLAGSNQSVRYSSSQNLGGFRKSIWDINNNFVSQSFPALSVVSGSAFVPQFKTPFELNAVDPQRILFVGANAIYESLNQGDTISQVGGSNPAGFLQDAVAYGGFLSGVPNEDVFYVGIGDDIKIRTTSGGAVSSVDPDAGSSGDIRDVVMDSDDWMTAFAIDNNQVFQTTNSGTSWSDITGNLMSIAGEALQTIAFIPGPVGALVVGGNLGVFTSLINALGTWSELGSNLPNAFVYDLKYDATDDVLVAGTLGRGAWTFPNASGITASPPPQVVSVVVGDGNPNRSGVAALTFNFDEAVTVSSAQALKVYNHTTSSSINMTAATLSGNGTTSVAWNLSAVSLPDGRYTAELPAIDATDATSQSLAGTHTLEFHVLLGDVSGDAAVNFADYNVVGSNFDPSSGTAFRAGDADGNGMVEFADYNVIGANFNPIGLAPLTYDLGDAPEASTNYPTTLANNGAVHVIGSGLLLGASVDAESDGQPHADALGDDNVGSDDEDGVTFGVLTAGSGASITVVAAVPSSGLLNAWVDFNADGDWSDLGEQIFTNETLATGSNPLNFNIPAAAVAGDTFARFRVTTAADYSFTGLAPDGEVEDYKITIAAASLPAGAPIVYGFIPSPVQLKYSTYTTEADTVRRQRGGRQRVDRQRVDRQRVDRQRVDRPSPPERLQRGQVSRSQNARGPASSRLTTPPATLSDVGLVDRVFEDISFVEELNSK